MNLVTQAFLRIFNPENIYTPEELLNNLTILKNFFQNNPKFSYFVLSKISFSTLKCVVNYWITALNGSENVFQNEVVSKLSEFFSQNNYNELLWISLAEKLKSINEIKINEDQVRKKENTEDIETNSEEYLLEKINENINQLKFCLIFIDIKNHSGRIMHYFPIITHLALFSYHLNLLFTES